MNNHGDDTATLVQFLPSIQLVHSVPKVRSGASFPVSMGACSAKSEHYCPIALAQSRTFFCISDLHSSITPVQLEGMRIQNSLTYISAFRSCARTVEAEPRPLSFDPVNTAAISAAPSAADRGKIPTHSNDSGAVLRYAAAAAGANLRISSRTVQRSPLAQPPRLLPGSTAGVSLSLLPPSARSRRRLRLGLSAVRQRVTLQPARLPRITAIRRRLRLLRVVREAGRGTVRWCWKCRRSLQRVRPALRPSTGEHLWRGADGSLRAL